MTAGSGGSHPALRQSLSRIWLGGLTSKTLSYPDLGNQATVDFLDRPQDGPVFGDLYRLEVDTVGEGAFGLPYPGWHRDCPCIVKIINKEVAGEAYRENLVEKGIFAVLLNMKSHRNVVSYLDMLEGPTYYYVIMERLDGPELFDHFVSQMPVTESMVQIVMHQVLSALAYIHDDCKLCHNDIKLENFRFKEPGDEKQNLGLKLLDFGFARVAGTDLEESISGTLLYLAPEVVAREATIRCKHALPSRDVWAAGVVLYIMLAGKEPWGDREVYFLAGDSGQSTVLERAMNQPELQKASPEATGLLRKLFNLDYKSRITAAQALKHPWFKVQNQKALAVSAESYRKCQAASHKSMRFSKVRVEDLQDLLAKTPFLSPRACPTAPVFGDSLQKVDRMKRICSMPNMAGKSLASLGQDSEEEEEKRAFSKVPEGDEESELSEEERRLSKDSTGAPLSPESPFGFVLEVEEKPRQPLKTENNTVAGGYCGGVAPVAMVAGYGGSAPPVRHPSEKTVPPTSSTLSSLPGSASPKRRESEASVSTLNSDMFAFD